MALAAISGWYLSGLAVTVALVVYPAFARVGPDRWVAYHRAHQRGVLAAVGPAWALEGVATLGWLLTTLGSGSVPGTLAIWQTLSRTLAIGHALAAAATVAATVLAAVPAHGSLATGFRARAHRRLLRAHRGRTLAWLSAALLATAGLATAALAT